MQTSQTVNQGCDIDKREGTKTIYREPLSVVSMTNEAIAPVQAPVTPMSVTPDSSPVTPKPDIHMEIPVALDLSAMPGRDYKHGNLGGFSFRKCDDIEVNITDVLEHWDSNDDLPTNEQIAIKSREKNMQYRHDVACMENMDDDVHERHGFRYHARKLFGKE